MKEKLLTKHTSTVNHESSPKDAPKSAKDTSPNLPRTGEPPYNIETSEKITEKTTRFTFPGTGEPPYNYEESEKITERTTRFTFPGTGNVTEPDSNYEWTKSGTHDWDSLFSRSRLQTPEREYPPTGNTTQQESSHKLNAPTIK